MSGAPATPYKIGLAGCGKMGSSMVRAWLSSNIADHIFILDPNGLPPELLSDPRITYCANEPVFVGHAANWDILVIAIKPQAMDDFCEAVKIHLPAQLPILSIAAGRTINSFQNHFGTAQPIIRSMPNTPASIGKGMTVACAAPNVSDNTKDIANNLLSSLGMIEWIDDESLLDAVTAVSGSGPAYVFYLIETLKKAGTTAGLDPDFAGRLARQTVIGSAALAEELRDVPAGILRENVTSPNGTTAAALEILMNGNFQDLMTQAVAKATARSKELSK